MTHRKKELQALIDTAEGQDWRVELRDSGHYAFYAPDGVGLVFMPSTPSDHRSIKNARSELRRHGLEV